MGSGFVFAGITIIFEKDKSKAAAKTIPGAAVGTGLLLLGPAGWTISIAAIGGGWLANHFGGKLFNKYK